MNNLVYLLALIDSIEAKQRELSTIKEDLVLQYNKAKESLVEKEVEKD